MIAERFHFHQRSQGVGESIAEYLAEQRRLITHCAYGTHLNEALRDRLVCGLRNVAIQKRLLSEADLTLETATRLALGMESAERNAQSLKGKEAAVNSMTTTHPKCHRCGKTTHDQKDCGYRDAECHRCGKRGHIGPVCRSSSRQQRYPPRPMGRGRGPLRQHQGTHHVTADQEQEDNSDSEALPLCMVGGSEIAPIKVPLVINGKLHDMELDTGAAVTIISENKCKELFPEAQPRKSPILLTGERLSVVGDLDVQVQYEEQTNKLVLTVVTGDGPSLLGRNWLQHLRLNWREIKAMKTHAVGSLEYLLDKYSDLFNEELGTIKPFLAKVHVEPGKKPKFFKSRSVPYAMRSPIEDELDRLE